LQPLLYPIVNRFSNGVYGALA